MMIIDRIEGTTAVVEVRKGEFRDVPLERVAGRARDGAVLAETPDGYTVDEHATGERSAQIAKKQRRIFKR